MGYRGQGGTVMPGRGLALEQLWDDRERERLAGLGAELNLQLEQVAALLGDKVVDVYLNGAAQLGRPLHPEEARYFAQVVRRIAGILLLGPGLDRIYEATRSE